MRQPCHKLGYIILLFMFRKKNIISHVLLKCMSLGPHMPKIKISIKKYDLDFSFKHLLMIVKCYIITLFFLFCRLQYFICCQLSTSLSWKDFKRLFNYCHVQIWMTFSNLMSPIQAKIMIPTTVIYMKLFFLCSLPTRVLYC